MCGETTDQLAQAPQESIVLLDSAPLGHWAVGKTMLSWDTSQT